MSQPSGSPTNPNLTMPVRPAPDSPDPMQSSSPPSPLTASDFAKGRLTPGQRNLLSTLGCPSQASQQREPTRTSLSLRPRVTPGGRVTKEKQTEPQPCPNNCKAGELFQDVKRHLARGCSKNPDRVRYPCHKADCHADFSTMDYLKRHWRNRSCPQGPSKRCTVKQSMDQGRLDQLHQAGPSNQMYAHAGNSGGVPVGQNQAFSVTQGGFNQPQQPGPSSYIQAPTSSLQGPTSNPQAPLGNSDSLHTGQNQPWWTDHGDINQLHQADPSNLLPASPYDQGGIHYFHHAGPVNQQQARAGINGGVYDEQEQAPLFNHGGLNEAPQASPFSLLQALAGNLDGMYIDPDQPLSVNQGGICEVHQASPLNPLHSSLENVHGVSAAQDQAFPVNQGGINEVHQASPLPPLHASLENVHGVTAAQDQASQAYPEGMDVDFDVSQYEYNGADQFVNYVPTDDLNMPSDNLNMPSEMEQMLQEEHEQAQNLVDERINSVLQPLANPSGGDNNTNDMQSWAGDMGDFFFDEASAAEQNAPQVQQGTDNFAGVTPPIGNRRSRSEIVDELWEAKVQEVIGTHKGLRNHDVYLPTMGNAETVEPWTAMDWWVKRD